MIENIHNIFKNSTKKAEPKIQKCRKSTPVKQSLKVNIRGVNKVNLSTLQKTEDNKISVYHRK